MAKSKETFEKREKEKKRQKAKEEKREKMEQRKANPSKGKGLDDMIAYIDENGNITSTPPDPRNRKVINAEDIQISVPTYNPEEEDNTPKQGVLAFFNTEKGYGFINDAQSGARVFVHISQLPNSIRENDKVMYEVEMGPRGANAVNVKKI